MQRHIFVAILNLLLAANCYAAVNTRTVITGTFTDPSGLPLEGSVTFTLPYAGLVTAEGIVVSPSPVSYPIQGGQIINTSASLINNVDIIPGNTAYRVYLKDYTGFIFANYYLYVPDVASFNIGTALQTTYTSANISFINLLVQNNTWTGLNTFTQPVTFQSSVTINAFGGGGGVQLTNPAAGELLISQMNIGQPSSGNGEIFLSAGNGTTASCAGMMAVISNTVNGETQFRNCSSVIDSTAAFKLTTTINGNAPFYVNWNANTNSLVVNQDSSVTFSIVAFASLGSTSSSMVWCSNCKNAQDGAFGGGATCANGGAHGGTLAIRQGSVWACL